MGRALRISALVGSLLAGCGSPPPPPADDAGRRAEVAALFDEIEARYPSVPPIDREGVGALGDRVVLVDVRPAAERAISVIPGALALEEFGSRTWAESTVVVAYCTVGERSGRFARELREEGIDARNLEGGILGWTHQGGSLVDAEGTPTRSAHVYGPRWDLLPMGWEGVQ